ncbi:molecular chaperone DnaJ [Phenylobacterium sp.]|uniref:J domain-containing protein n=1 Tax=Phenylobacterium sp. TaxID=1871053 RepID=UPI002736C4E8|nr:molecular chaperone DnaJ [Phenylobacterium sp.]MDP3660207.1 molecular chaperone DnaJ [Phenylobacterium sp.]
MIYIALGAGLLAFLVWVGRGGRSPFKRREWRLLAAALSLAAFAAAAFVGMRGGIGTALALALAGLWLAGSVRRAPAVPRGSPASSQMSLTEARSTLGVEPGATHAEVKAAHARLIRLAHPDAGGTVGLAAQLNAARDRLLRE